MLNKLKGSRDIGEEEMLNKLESIDENNSEGSDEEEILNIFDDNEGNLWGNEKDSDLESKSNIEIEERIKNRLLRIELELKYRQMPAIEYNKKHVVYEYLIKTEINGIKKMVASKKMAKMIYFTYGPYKLQKIRKDAKYWLKYNKFLISLQGQHQKIIRLIDNKDVTKKCYQWIRS
ncbi:12520_t:CDS:2 [Funneliformis geosporum]|nr:12520_t:CDS:2 [Funneliformis geosporum]